MRLSQFHLRTSKETPADAEIVSHKLMLKAGMLRKLAAGLYTWSPLGLRVLRKVERVVREEMDRAGAIELLMPTIQPQELWEETGRWQKFGPQLLKIKDRKDAEYCYAPDRRGSDHRLRAQELASYKQLPVNFYQIQTKFRDEIRPRFGVMRAREFLMKDAYSFHVDEASLDAEYRNMYDTYGRIFTRLGLKFRAVFADTGAIGGSASHEFHVLGRFGRGRDRVLRRLRLRGQRRTGRSGRAGARAPRPRKRCARSTTPTQKTCEDVAALLGIPLQRTVKSVALMRARRWRLRAGAGARRSRRSTRSSWPSCRAWRTTALATEAEIVEHLGSEPGFLGPARAERSRSASIADRSVAAMADFVVGANEAGFHIAGVNWGRDLPEPRAVADIRNAVAGDPSPGRQGHARHRARHRGRPRVRSSASKYSEAMDCTVLDAAGKAVHAADGLLRHRRVAHRRRRDRTEPRRRRHPLARGDGAVAGRGLRRSIRRTMRPSPSAAEALYRELVAAGIDAALDDRGLRPGAMFADIELIGIPHRVVVSERGLAAGTFEYRARSAAESGS